MTGDRVSGPIRPLAVALLLVALAPALTGCGDDPPTEPPPTAAEVEVRPSGALVGDLGETVTLEAVALDAEGEELSSQPTDFTWRSTNPVVATVGAGGTVTGRATGQVTVTAELGEVTGHAVVTVNQPATQPVSGWERVASPTTERLLDVWGSAPDDVWAVGFDGVIVHFDGTEWREVASPAESFLQGIWGSGPDDVWAVGGRSPEGVTLHFDGTAWQQVPNPAKLGLADVWGSAPDDVWAVGFASRIFHFDGTEWMQVSTPPTDRSLRAIWGSAPDDIWAVGLGGVILHYDGTAWSAVPNPAEEREFFVDLFGIWGTGPDDVWAVGDAGFLHYDGTSWTLAAESTERLFDVWGSGPNDVWVGATDGETSHYDGTAWRGVTNPTDKALFGVWEMTPGDLWVVGLEGEILRGRR